MEIVPLPSSLDTTQPSTVLITVTQKFSAPCRRCLSNAKPGETVFLLSYNPFLHERRTTPYSGPGPIFVHTHECTRFDSKGTDTNMMGLPEEWNKRILSVRGYNNADMMVYAKLVDAVAVKQTMEEEVFGEKALEVSYVHIHFPGAGCFAFKVQRGE